MRNKIKKNRINIILYAVVTAILFISFATGISIKFLSSALKISDPTGKMSMADAYETFQADSDLIVYSTLLYYDTYDENYTGMWQRKVPEDMFKRVNKIRKEYGRSKKFDQKDYSRYASSCGFQGIFWGIWDKVLPADNIHKIAIFECIACLLAALSIAYILLWLKDIAGKGTLVINVLWLSLASFFTISIAGSVYWMFFTWWLPMIVTIYCCKNKKSNWGLLIGLFFTVLLRCLCGYEYISTIMIALTVPLFFYWIEYKWSLKTMAMKLFQVIGTALGAFFTSIALYLFQYRNVYGSFSKALNRLQYTILRRCAPSSNSFNASNNIKTSDSIVKALDVSVSDVLKEYFWGRLGPLRYGYIVIITALFFIVVIYLNYKKRVKPDELKTVNALCIATFIAFLAPLSWLVLCKAHAHIHTHISYVLFDVPFILIAVALCWKTLIAFLHDMTARSFAIKVTDDDE